MNEHEHDRINPTIQVFFLGKLHIKLSATENDAVSKQAIIKAL